MPLRAADPGPPAAADGAACGADDGQGDYLNCPMTEVEYRAFHRAVCGAEVAALHAIDQGRFFEGCLPIEVMARRGEDTLRFGPMKPVGLADPRTGRRPYAVVQLRQDTLAGDHYSLVGFQTQLKWGEQKRIFRTIPGLERAEFVRLGMIHRNTYINGPAALLPTWQSRHRPGLFFAGQISGVEGYVESAASGLIAGLNAAALARGARANRAAEDHRHRRARPLRVARQRGRLPAVQHRVRAHTRDRRRPAPPARPPARGGRARARADRGMAGGPRGPGWRE